MAAVQYAGAKVAEALMGVGTLPTNKDAEFPYIPPKGAKGKPLCNGGVCTDKAGNKWKWDKSRHRGPHWDVTLKNRELINVDETGKIIRQGKPRKHGK